VRPSGRHDESQDYARTMSRPDKRHGDRHGHGHSPTHSHSHHRHTHRSSRQSRTSHSHPHPQTNNVNAEHGHASHGHTRHGHHHPTSTTLIVPALGAPEYSSVSQGRHGSYSNGPVVPIINPMPDMPMSMPLTPPVDPVYYGQEFEAPDHSRKRDFFQYSQCTGRKKALCVGINYRGQPHQLSGCIGDAKRMRRFLIENYGYKEGDIVVLSDDGRTRREQPTRQNIIDAMHWLVKNARAHDSLVFHYSGHGGQTKDLDGDEEDGFDEVIFPLDFKTAGHLVDDLMHDIMVKPLPPGCRLTAIFDSCHSGSALDLPYTYSTSGRVKDINIALELGEDTLGGAQGYQVNDVNGLTNAFKGLVIQAGKKGRKKRRARQIKRSPADVISWSGCKDSQTSADTYEAGTATGAMSYAFMKALKKNRNLSYQQLLIEIRKTLHDRFSQKPQLSSSHPIDTKVKYIM